MRTRIIAAFMAVSALAVAQKVKSKAEGEALIGIQAEQDPAAKMAKVDAFIAKFADTEFKAWAYNQATQAADQKNDGTKVLIYADLAIEADPKAYHPMLMAAAELARSTRENDLDKEEKLTKADKLAHQALDIIPAATKPNPQITEDQWAEIKKEFTADGHRDLGMIATVRKKYDVAIAEFKQAVEIPGQPDLATFVRLAAVYNDAKQPDEAQATLAKMEALVALAKKQPSPQPNPIVVSYQQLKPFVDKEQKRAEALKALKK
jgi:hypothetical protein